MPERGYPAGWRRFPRGSQHHRPDGRQHASPTVLGLVLLHRRRTRHELADRDRYRGRWVHPDRRSAERRRPRAGLGHAETAAASVRDQHSRRVRGRRRPLPLDEAGRRSYRRGRQRDRLSPQGNQHARLTTRRWVLSREAVTRGYDRRLPPLILALNWDRFALFAMRACLAAAVAALVFAEASEHTHGTRPRPRYGALLGARMMSPSPRSDSRARRMEATRL